MNFDDVVKLEGGLRDQLYAIKTDNSVWRYDAGGLKKGVWYPYETEKKIVKMAISSKDRVHMLDKEGRVWQRQTDNAQEKRLAQCHVRRRQAAPREDSTELA